MPARWLNAPDASDGSDTAAANQLAAEISSKLAGLPSRTTPAVRSVRRDYSRGLAEAPPEVIIKTALLLANRPGTSYRFFAYELVAHHPAAFGNLTLKQLLQLGRGIDSWDAVDCFACILSGPVWREGRLPADVVPSWAQSADPWWRRAAAVSTVALCRRGKPDDVRRVIEICGMLAGDREDLVVKAVSWALRELAKKHPREAREFLTTHSGALAPRVTREVRNKLTTGLKNPRRPSKM